MCESVRESVRCGCGKERLMTTGEELKGIELG